MNRLQFNLLRKSKVKSGIEYDPKLTDKIYSIYKMNMLVQEKNVNISKEEMNKLLTITYSVLALNLTNQEFESVSLEYINLIVGSSLKGNEVNIKWCINHLWYYRLGDKVIVEKFTDDIELAQNLLKQEFNFEAKDTKGLCKRLLKF